MEGYGFEAYEEQTREATAMDIVEAFRAEGERVGYQSVECELMPYEDLKVRWARAGGRAWIRWFPSDMLVGVPMYVVEDVVSTIYRKLDATGGPEDVKYDGRTMSYLDSDEMCLHVQPMVIERKGLKTNVGGLKRYLEQASLVLPNIPDHIVAKYGDEFQYSVISRVITVPRSLKGASQNVKWAMLNKAVVGIARGLEGSKDEDRKLEGVVPVPVELTRDEMEELIDARVYLRGGMGDAGSARSHQDIPDGHGQEGGP